MFGFSITEEKIQNWQEQRNLKKLAKALFNKKESIRTAAINALLKVADPTGLQLLEQFLGDPNEKIQMLVADGFRDLNYLSTNQAYNLTRFFILRDRQSIFNVGKQAQAFLTDKLKEVGTDKAEFAAELLTAENWQPNNKKFDTYLFLAQQKFAKLDIMDSETLSIIHEYYEKQKDVALRRLAVKAIVESENDKSLFYLEKYANDPDEEISNLTRTKARAIKRKQFAMNNQQFWNSFFPIDANINEMTATKFIRTGLEYLEHELYYEAYCALAIAGCIYERLTGGYHIKEGLTIGDLETRRDREIKVFGDFKLEHVLEKISEKIRGKKEEKSIIKHMLAQNQNESDFNLEHTKLNQILASREILDTEFVAKTINYLIVNQFKDTQAWRAILHLPDQRLVSSLISCFKHGEFMFYPIQALIYIGNEAIPELITALSHKDDNYRSNAAFTLAMINNQETKEVLSGALKSETNFMVELTLHFALARLEENSNKLDHIDFMFQKLDDENSKICEQAARCIRHLNCQLDYRRLEKYFSHSNAIVRLHMVSTVPNIDGTVPESVLVSLTQRLFEETENSTLEKVVTTLSSFKENKKLVNLLMEKLPIANPKQKENMVTILGNIKAKESINLLLKLWPKSDSDIKQSLLWTYGQLDAIESLKYMKKALKNDLNLRRNAALGLVFLSDVDSNSPKKILKQIDCSESRMALGLLGDEMAIHQIRDGLRPENFIQELFTNIDSAMMIQASEFIQPLYKLLDYANADYYPTDRYVRHSAIEALVKIILAN